MVGQMSTTKRRFWHPRVRAVVRDAVDYRRAGVSGGMHWGIGEPCNRDGTCQGDLVCVHTGVIGTTIGAPIHRCILRESFK